MTSDAGNWGYVIAAFAVAWLGIGGYWLYASRKARRAYVVYVHVSFEDRAPI